MIVLMQVYYAVYVHIGIFFVCSVVLGISELSPRNIIMMIQCLYNFVFKNTLVEVRDAWTCGVGFEMAFFSLLLRSQYAEPSFLQVIISILLRISLVWSWFRCGVRTERSSRLSFRVRIRTEALKCFLFLFLHTQVVCRL